MDGPFIAHSAEFFKNELRPRKTRALVDLSERSAVRAARDLLESEYIKAPASKTVAIAARHRVGETLDIARSLQLAIGLLVILPPGEKTSQFDTTLAAILSGITRHLDNECRVVWLGGRTAFVVPRPSALRVRLFGLHGSTPIPVKNLDRWPQATLLRLVEATKRAEALTLKAASAQGVHDSPNTLLAYSRIETRDANAAWLAKLAPQPAWLQ